MREHLAHGRGASAVKAMICLAALHRGESRYGILSCRSEAPSCTTVDVCSWPLAVCHLLTGKVIYPAINLLPISR